eukprot:TRINITY_DN18141_c0_g1_i1.p1 TRINITY_DN18141_c0_g1~~TRINITY_DN18141_c0_g1_i1.p1  ORF type:complete len:205 (-),score=53.72 TRINITY_DN18141_c0_g1_i1:72-653(-)
MGRQTSSTAPVRRSSRSQAVPCRASASRSETVVQAVRSMAGSMLSTAAAAFERSYRRKPAVHDDDEGDGTPDVDELRQEFQDALRSRAACILERYQEIVNSRRPEQARETQDQLGELTTSLKQLTDAERSRGKFLRSLRGELESLAAELRGEVAAAAAAAAKTKGAQVPASLPSAARAAPQQRPARGRRTLRD